MNQSQVSQITRYSVALMILTSLHHVYGAVVYNTPWRTHALLLSIPVVVLTLILSKLLSKKDAMAKSALFWLFILITIIPSVGLIGIFEGVYNHILKNIMFFGGASEEALQSLFPAPTYEMPSDLIFEITGVLQGFMVIPIVLHLAKLLSDYFDFYKRA